MLKQLKRITMHSPFICDSRYSDSFAQLQPMLSTIPDDELIAVRGDVLRLLLSAIESLPEYREMRAAIAKQLPTFDLERFDRLETCANALAFAHASFVLIRQQPVPLGPLCGACMDYKARLEAIARDRQRAYTLFVSTYDHVRRAVIYMCWDEREVRRGNGRLGARRARSAVQ